MTIPLIPAPASLSLGDGEFTIRDASGVAVISPELDATVRLFFEDVRRDSGITLAMAATDDAPSVTIGISSDGLESVALAAGIRADGRSGEAADERNGLSITGEGVRVWGATVEGVHRGLTSLRQLIAATAEDGVANLPAAEIVDGPRFAWRGLSFDVVRMFQDVETVCRVIDMLSVYKMNVLHLHLTDDQGWRVEVPSRPALTEIGAAGALGERPGGFYTIAEVSELVGYAAARHITLVPEVDMPGHTGAIFRAYPELAPASAGEVAPGFTVGTLDPARDETWRFVEDVLDAVIPQFPQSNYFHVGGDEAFGMADDAHAAFMDRVVSLVRARGRRAVGWQEISRAGIGEEEIAQYWMDPSAADHMLSSDALKAMIPEEALPLVTETVGKAHHDVPLALEAGSRVLISPTSRLYFDSPHGDGSADPAQEELHMRVGLPIYPPLSLRHGVEWDPVAETPGVDSDEHLAGVEAAIWCETIATGAELEFMLLPRLGGASEKGWARAGITDWDGYAQRLAAQAGLWNAHGWHWFAADSVAWAKEDLLGRPA